MTLSFSNSKFQPATSILHAGAALVTTITSNKCGNELIKRISYRELGLPVHDLAINCSLFWSSKTHEIAPDVVFRVRDRKHQALSPYSD